MIRLRIVTAVSRPENLSRIGSWLALHLDAIRSLEWSWHLYFDMARSCVGGQRCKNRGLDSLQQTDWLYILDDDTLPDPTIFQRFAAIVSDDLKTRAVIFSQRREDGSILHAGPENVAPQHIDIGQAFLRRDFIGAGRIPERYDGDGIFLACILRVEPSRVRFVDEPLSRHNSLRDP